MCSYLTTQFFFGYFCKEGENWRVLEAWIGGFGSGFKFYEECLGKADCSAFEKTIVFASNIELAIFTTHILFDSILVKCNACKPVTWNGGHADSWEICLAGVPG